MDIQLVAGLSELYQMQDSYRANIDWYDPAFHEAGARKLHLALDELYYDENEVLLPLYNRLQPLVHAAAGHK